MPAVLPSTDRCGGDDAIAVVEGRHLSLRLLPPADASQPDVAPLTVRYPLHDLSLAIHAGDRVALTGPSGAGKSVLLRTLALLDRPAAGAVYYRGAPVAAQAVPAYRRAIAYLPQRPTLPGETVRDALQQPFTLAVRRDQHFDERLAVDWLQRAGKDAAFLDKRNATLSGGEAQVAALVRTLMLAPEVLLLDEPTAALDPDSVVAVEALVARWYEGADARAYVWIGHDPAQALRVGAQQWRLGRGFIDLPRASEDAVGSAIDT